MKIDSGTTTTATSGGNTTGDQSAEYAEPDFYAEKCDLDVARHINLALLLNNGISEEDAGFDHVTTLNDTGLCVVARIIGEVRASAKGNRNASE